MMIEGQVDSLGPILMSLKKNSDHELELISQLELHLQDIARSLTIGSQTIIKQSQSIQKTVREIEKQGTTARKKGEPRQIPSTRPTNNATDSTRPTESLLVAKTRTKPVYQTQKNTAHAPNFQEPKLAIPGPKISTKEQKTTEKLATVVSTQIEQSQAITDFWRDEKGRLRHKSGRYANSDERKAYDTAEREKEKKNQSLIAKLLGVFTNEHNSNLGDSEAADAVGTAAGGSFFYAAKDLISLAQETGEKISELRPGESEHTNDSLREKSDRKQELAHQAEQTEVLKEQSAEQAKSYQKAITLLEDIDRNTQEKQNNLLSSIGSLASVLSGMRKGRKGSIPDIDVNHSDDKKGKRKGKRGSKKPITIANQDKSKRKKPRSVLQDSVTEIESKKNNKFLKAAKSAKWIAPVAAMASLADNVINLSDRDDLSLSQKAVKVGTSTGGAALGGWGGAAAGGAAGAAIGSVVPILGTAAGGIVGSVLGSFAGSTMGEKAGAWIGDNFSQAIAHSDTISETLSSAWETTLKDSKSTLMSLFGQAVPQPLNDTEPHKAVAFDKHDSIEKRIDSYDPIIKREAQRNQLPPELIEAVIRQESGGKVNARSSVGAKGLMQLMDGTAKDLGVTNSFDPEQNIKGGTRYLAQHVSKYQKKGYAQNDAIQLALASYNAGSGWVDAAIKQSGNSQKASDVLTSLRDPNLTFKGRKRSASNIKQSDDYVKKIYGNYAYRVNPIAKVLPSKAQAMSEKTHAITANSSISTPSIERVSDIAAIKPSESKSIPSNTKSGQTAARSRPHVSSTTTKQTQSTNVTKNTTIAAPTIPMDFDDATLRLMSLDLN